MTTKIVGATTMLSVGRSSSATTAAVTAAGAQIGTAPDRHAAQTRTTTPSAKQMFSGKAIAPIAVVCEATVKTHVARMLGKLQLRDRVQAVVHAYERGLVRPGAR
jgi:regulatory LuxR family protein